MTIATDTNNIYFEDTRYGFIYGGMTVERLCSDKREGWVVLGVATKKYPKWKLQIYVTKTGKVRIYVGNEELKMRKVKT